VLTKDVPLTILFRDERVVVVDKPPGLLVHRTENRAGEPALLQLLRDQIGRRVHPIHRLDRMASGLLAYGLDSASACGLQGGLQAPDARKEYLVLARGACPAAFESRAPLLDDHGFLRAAHGSFRRVAFFPFLRATLLIARLYTGRSHQIRRHLALAGHHVLGDTRYGKAGSNRRAARHGLTRLFLHAWRLDIAHPAGGRLSVSAPLPRDLAVFLGNFDGESLLALDRAHGSSSCAR
jgi:tRNA pseudouridine65 synthase